MHALSVCDDNCMSMTDTPGCRTVVASGVMPGTVQEQCTTASRTIKRERESKCMLSATLDCMHKDTVL
jgi:hypothetical protein